MLNILFLGNSFTNTNNLPHMLTKIAGSAGVEIFTASVLKGGAFLHNFTDPAHELSAQLAEVYPTRKWDYIVLQDHAFNPAKDPEDFLDSAATLCAQMQCGAQFLFYSTWPYRTNTAILDSIGLTYTAMLDGLTSSYQKAADTLGGIRVPVGNAFALSTQVNTDIDLYRPDDYHPSPCGTYLAACLFFKAITGRSAAELSVPEGVSAEDGKKLRIIADRF